MSVRRYIGGAPGRVMAGCGIDEWGIFSIDRGSIGRSSLRKRFEECTVVCVAVPYTAEQSRYQRTAPAGSRQPAERLTGAAAYVEAFAWNTDYHRDVRERLERVAAELAPHLRPRVPAEPEACRAAVSCEILVDNSGLDDREIALRAGIGLLGRNNLLLSPRYGTRFFIGYLLYPLLVVPAGAEEIDQTLVWSADEPPGEELREPFCAGCGACVRRCPTGALERDMSRCISYLTQTKDPVPEEWMPYFENQLYGCSICQRVCPLNRERDFTGDSYVDPKEILGMSVREFKSKYGRMGYAWRPLWVYKRNALIVLGNIGSAEDLRWLESRDFSGDPRLAEVAEISVRRLKNRVFKTGSEC